MCRLLYILLATLFFGPVIGAADRPDFDIKVHVVEDDSDDEIDVYGKFTTDEGKYGGIELVFYHDVYSYSIKSIENIEDMLMEPDDPNIDMGSTSIDMIIRLLLKPTKMGDGTIKMTGRLQKMINSNPNSDPSFIYKTEKVDLTLPNNGQKLFKVKSPNSGREYKFNLEVNSLKALNNMTKVDDVSFMASYSLYNENEKQFEVENELCTLKPLVAMKKDDLICSHHKTFNLPNGDSLLYLVTYNLDDIYRHDNGSFDLSFMVNRYYYINPRSFFGKDGLQKRNNLPYSEGNRQIDQEVNINGKSRKIYAEIDDGEVIKFRWENANLTSRDIVGNWDDIVSILKKIDDNNYDYIPPDISGMKKNGEGLRIEGLLNSPDNFTGDRVKSMSYGKTITLYPGEKTEMMIPFKDSPLPFEAREFITLNNPDEFIPVDVMPEMTFQMVPEYPSAAKREKLEAEVYVKAYVDKTGNVKSAYILKSDNPGHGFEEAALEAAYKNKFRPGEQDGNPVALWIAYSVRFALDKK